MAERNRLSKKTGRRLGLLLAAACLCLAGCGGSKEKYELREEAIRQMDAGDYAGAIETFQKALEQSDGFVGEFELDILKYRAEAECQTGDYGAAADTYDILRQVDGEKPEYVERMGLMYAMDDQMDQAVEAYQLLSEIEPDSPEAAQLLLLIGDRLTGAGRAEEAIALFQEAVNEGRESGAIYNQLALSQMEAGEYDLALDYIQKGLELNSDGREQLLYNQAVAREKKLDFAGALESLTLYEREFGETPEVEKEIAFLKTRTD